MAATVLVAAACLSCQHPAQSVPPAASSQQPPDPVPWAREADDAGRFLAGLPGRDGSSFRDLEANPAWQVHRQEMDRAWQNIEARTLPAMREFQETELSGALIEHSLVFYPFSGPDALMLTVFFPRNSTYVMVGLEPPGTLPTPQQFAQKDLGNALEQIRDTVSSELQRSFFITRQMDRQFRGQVTDGLFPPILHLLVRANNRVLGYRYVRFEAGGRIGERNPKTDRGTKALNKGVEIDFFNPADRTRHKLYYFSVNLSDSRIRKNEPFLAFLSQLSGVTTFFKATSYMLHQPGFTVIRDQVLAHSGAVLQDDSGIQYRFFPAPPWRVQLYGEFDRPFGSFKWFEQPDLKKAYATEKPKPLNFRIGYGFSQVPSNLLLATKPDR
ncbi:MAG: hypothetical protein HY822_10260 [Acidobacteria bacterium]|nr:hypothetical protein [Acidobacteriota bacterium]